MMTPSPSGEQHATFRLADVHCLDCADAVERALKANPHITQVQFDWANDVVQVGYHPGMITPAAIEQLITTSGCSCVPAGRREAVAAPPAQQKM
jgi:copper chaperone CopZ